MRELAYKHYFTVVGNKFLWEDQEMFRLKKKMLNGKKGYAIIEEEVDKASSNQLAYYFGGIIRKECMNSNTFAFTRPKVNSKVSHSRKLPMRTQISVSMVSCRCPKELPR